MYTHWFYFTQMVGQISVSPVAILPAANLSPNIFCKAGETNLDLKIARAAP